MKSLIAKISQVLDDRDRMFPDRDEFNTREMHRLLEEFFLAIDDDHMECWAADTKKLNTVSSIADDAVFLCGYMKSGTTLLIELLDGHDEIITLPGDSFMITRVSEKNREEKYTWESWRNNWVKRMVNPTGQKPFWILGKEKERYGEFLRYLDYWHADLEESWKNPVLSTVFSYFCANQNRPASPRIWVEKTPGNEFRIDWVLDLFPQAKFIHITRDPRENMASLKKLYKSRSWDWRPKTIAKNFGRSCSSAVDNQKRLGKSRYMILQYEQLTKNPQTEMKKIADYLGVSWSETLLRPTVNSLPANANSMYADRKATGFIRYSSESKWRKVLTGKEQTLINRTLFDARKVGYHWPIGFFDYSSMWLKRLFHCN